MSDKDTIAALQRHLADAEVERLRLAAEVERLRFELEQAQTGVLNANEQVSELKAALRDVAERQREACAEYLKHWTYDEHTLSRVRATPLVTEEEP